jgi:hypothetical protein
MADVTVVRANVRPLQGAIIRRAIAGEAIAFGDSVYVSSYSGDMPVVSLTDGNGALGLTRCFGVVVAPQTDTNGATSVASGAACDVVVFGPVTGYTDAPTGAHVWISDTAGQIATAVSGTHSCIVGVAESLTVILVRPFAGTASA